jgi:hypothetical protein
MGGGGGVSKHVSQNENCESFFLGGGGRVRETEERSSLSFCPAIREDAKLNVLNKY